MFIIKNTLTYRIKQITPYRDAKIEYQCITIISKKSETDILNMYIPPNTTLEQEEFLHYLNQLQNQFIICGDMNGRHRLWEPSSYRNNNPIGNVLCEILDNHDNITLATPPDLNTHMDGNTGNSSTIDLCFVSPHLLPQTNVQTLDDMRSDHLPVQVTLNIEPNRKVRGKRSKWIINDEFWPTWQKKCTEPSHERTRDN
ncbi:unnamed protein product [Meganyctiphanes norvegica]|uniref:Endonuclease/exonuclease/phosphatase domain-containing protein n=1 Tax=Meganyctiphanes norvegica TaxID=48144 RepID=A0AAV2SNF4_MEGNR